MRSILVLWYFRWIGTSEEFKEYMGRLQGIIDGIEGIDLKGVFVPASEWNFVLLLDVVNYDKALKAYKTYIRKYGVHPKIPLAKSEILGTFEELGLPFEHYMRLK